MKTRFGRLIALWCVAVIPLLVFAPDLDAYELPKSLALHLAAAVLWLSAAVGGSALSTAWLAPVGVFLVVGLVASLLSPLPLTGLFGEYTSYQGWLHWLSMAALLAVLPGVVRGRRDGPKLLAAAALGLTLVAGHALLQLVVPADAADPLRRAYGTAGNAYFLGTLLAIGVPVAAGLAAGAASPGRRGWWLGCGAVILAGVLSSGSRSALAAALGGGAIVAGWRGRRILVPVAVLAAVTLTACGLLLPADRNPFPPLLERIADVAHGRDARGEIWAMAGRLIRSGPLAGHGPDSFATLGAGVQTPALWAHLWRGSPEKAHNELLQVAATTGVVGLGAVLWMLAVAARAARPALRTAAGFPAAAGLAALAFTGLFGFTTMSPQAVSIPLLALLLAGLPVRLVPPEAARAVAAALWLPLLAQARFLVADARLRDMIATGAPTPNAALIPDTPFANRLLRAGDLLERRWLGSTLGGDRPTVAALTRMRTLAALYDGARSLNPLQALAHSSLARLAAREGRLQDADDGYRKARSLAPRDAYLALEHGQILLAAGREADGLAALAQAGADYPGFAEPVGMAGYAHLKAGRTAEAEPLLARSLALDWHGNASAAYAAAMNLATLYHRSHREADARRTAALAESWKLQIKP